MATPPRRFTFVVFPGLTLLDFVGPYDALRRVRTMGVDPGVSWRVVGSAPEVRDDCGLPVAVEAVLPTPDDGDLLVVPGGLGADAARGDRRLIDWLAAWPGGGAERVMASVCSGALLLGDAGHLRRRRATTHHARFEALAPLCSEVVRDARVVDEGAVVTAGGVTSGIDLGLHLVERFWGAPARTRIATQMEWGRFCKSA